MAHRRNMSYIAIPYSLAPKYVTYDNRTLLAAEIFHIWRFHMPHHRNMSYMANDLLLNRHYTFALDLASTQFPSNANIGL